VTISAAENRAHSATSLKRQPTRVKASQAGMRFSAHMELNAAFEAPQARSQFL
jgi:hypothetical protein